MAAAASAEPVSPELALVDATLAAELRALDAPALYVVPTPPPTGSETDEAVVEAIEHSTEAPILEVELNDPIADLVEETVEPTLVEPHHDVPAYDPIADLIVADIEPQVVEPVLETTVHDPSADLIAEEVEPRVAELSTFDPPEPDPSADLIAEETDQHEPSGYPALPSPASDGPEPVDVTETVLREIRDRLTAPPVPASRRRRFRRRFTVASGLSTAIALGVFAVSAGFGVTQLPV